MANVKPFKGVRPVADKAKDVASRPYDVLNTQEAREEAGDNKNSFLHVVKPEINFPDDHNPYSQDVYEKGRENYERLKKEGVLKQDGTESFYIYRLIMDGRVQTGLVGCNDIDAYFNGTIKKHELTRNEKEEDRKNHVRTGKMNAEPVFFTYESVSDINQIVEAWTVDHKPEYDFTAEDGIRHILWAVDEPDTVRQISELFRAKVDAIYVADGHHRTAAAALVGKEFKDQNKEHKGTEEYNYFMSVLFPHDQLHIIDYNRVITDLNDLSEDEFLEKLRESFEVEEVGSEAYRPKRLHEFSMYMDGKWYRLQAHENTYNDDDPLGVLDVSILSGQVLEPILGIKDLRKDKRIDFVGGIRGLNELKKRVDNGEMKVAFALYPVTMQQIMNISDQGAIMPPKTTWFEPKLRSGLVVHELFS